ncbi:MAG TPA: hypothetical protein VHC69_34105 [Polyangiaceae bacterium]|nr:hypothetical protein [Polyangiaceae bacterium]
MKTIVALVLATPLAACGAQTPHVDRPTGAVTRAPVATYSGFRGPESVLYDAERDRYLVSNVNGAPLALDGNGFISVLSPDGRVASLEWIEGGKNGVTLNAPKGLAIADGVLYVADVSVVRRFDAATGAPKGDIPVPGSTFLNDLATGPDGRVYLSDAGAPTGRFDAKGTEAVYVIERDTAKPIAQGPLGRPDAVAWSAEGLIVAPFGASEVYRLDDKGAKRAATPLPAGGLAGIVEVGDSLFVSSFQASSIFVGKLGGRFEVALANQEAPADIGYDGNRRRLLVPHFTEDTVEAFALE